MNKLPATVTGPVLKKNQPDDNYKCLPPPSPAGKYPYHLNLRDVIPDQPDQKMVFHMAGDTGHNFISPAEITEEMTKQYAGLPEISRPQFLYHLGDIVYHYGEASGYAKQFFKPFALYPGPIFAIPGNHDSDVNPDSRVPYNSLDAFTSVFCDTVSKPFNSGGTKYRNTMVQPNVYWTLKAPLANIIGLYSNIPKYGYISAEQREWFKNELIAANKERPGKALLVCLHHAPYSADTNHGSSLNMINLLEGVFDETGIRPDLVASGHVHNYQRFHKTYADGKVVPYLVAGAGGFEELHSVVMHGDDRFSEENALFKNVALKAYCDQQHGFLKISIEKSSDGLLITGKYYAMGKSSVKDGGKLTTLADQFSIMVS